MPAKFSTWVIPLIGGVGILALAIVLLMYADAYETLYAPLEAIDPLQGTVVVTDAKGQRLTLILGEGSRILVDGEPAATDALRPGMQANIAYEGKSRRVRLIKTQTSGASATGGPAQFAPAGGASGASPANAASDAAPKATSDGVPATPPGAAAAGGGDWPQWRGPRQDGISQETGLLARWPQEGPKLLWRQPCGEGYSAPAVAGNRLFIMDLRQNQEWVNCLDAASGEKLWESGYDGAFIDQTFGSGPRATPTVVDGRVYTQGATGIVHCLDAATGKVLWRKNLLEVLDQENITWGISGSPLVVGQRVWLNPGVALDATSGEVKFKANGDAPGYSTPVYFQLGTTPIVACFTAEGLVGIHEATGTELFRHAWTTQYDANIATPIVAGNLVFISSGYDAGCALLELFEQEGEITAREVYRNKKMRNHFDTCVLYAGHLYGFDEGFLTCLELRTGKQKWRVRGYGKGALTLADGLLYVQGEQGKLALVRPNVEKLDEVASFQPLEGKCWTVPVIARGRLYVRNETEIKCYDIRAR